MKPLKYLIGSGLVALVTALSNPVFADEKPKNIPVVNVENKYWQSADDACKAYSQYPEVFVNSKGKDIKSEYHCKNGKPTGKQLENINDSDIEKYYSNNHLDLIVDYDYKNRPVLTAFIPINPEEYIDYTFELITDNGKLKILTARVSCHSSRYKKEKTEIGTINFPDPSKECSSKEWRVTYEPPTVRKGIKEKPGRFYNLNTEKLNEFDVKKLRELISIVSQMADKYQLPKLLPKQDDIKNMFNMINNQLKGKKWTR